MVDLVKLVGRPVPENAAARDIILAGLLNGKARGVSKEEKRLQEAIPQLLQDGLIIKESDDEYKLAAGAMDAASAAKKRMLTARDNRRIWGEELQAKLREIKNEEEYNENCENQARCGASW